jgi:hypothetical protein
MEQAKSVRRHSPPFTHHAQLFHKQETVQFAAAFPICAANSKKICWEKHFLHKIRATSPEENLTYY